MRSICCGLLFALSVACSSEPAPPSRDVSVRDTGTDRGVAVDTGTDSTMDSFETVSICPPAEGAFSAACSSDDDCDRGICLEDGTGGICTDFCLDTCPSFCDGRRTFCRGIESGGSVAFVCAPELNVACQPCQADVQCGSGACLEFPDGTRACGSPCDSDGDCADGFDCGTFEGSEGQCVPATGSCTCRPENEGLQRPCDNTNDVGTCGGTQTCQGSGGWSSCDAATPAAEMCNGIDDNCDGLVDNGAEIGPECRVEGELGACPGVAICGGEAGYTCFGDPPAPDTCDGLDNDCDGIVDQDFVDDDGAYTTDENCGACGVDCARRIAFALETSCEVVEGVPRCVVERCEDGYRPRGDFACVPLIPNLCEPCAVAEDCSAPSPGALCITVTDAADESREALVCGRDCSDDSVFGTGCPDGYVCDDIAGMPDVRQCVPASGTCSCIGAPPGFNVPCVIEAFGEVDLEGTVGAITCGGARFCDGDELGVCELPDDACNGFDDDCNGRIDDTFRNDDGHYDTDEHCGRCNNDCSEVFTPATHNATGRCASLGAGTACEMVCEPGFHDLHNGTDDGCECEELPGDDLPSLTPDDCDGACDTDCDGIDGDEDRALFVSKIGIDSSDAGSRSMPLSSIGAALGRARDCNRGTASGFCPSEDVRDIYVASGVYSENIELRAGINIFGGYSLDFGVRDVGANPTTIYGVALSGDQRGTVTADVITRDTRVSGFSIYGYPATSAGHSSYAVYVSDSTEALVFESNTIVGSNGADGGSGERGRSGASGGDGGTGELGRQSASISCGVSATPGGSAGASSCSAAGGTGGSANCPAARTAAGAECSFFSPSLCLNTCAEGDVCTPLPPPQGIGATGEANAGCGGDSCGAGGDPAYDFWSDFGVCGTCGNQVGLRHIGGEGENGREGRDGTGGAGCSDVGGRVNSVGLWVGNGGFDGLDNATSGGGGGGGSAGGGFDIVSGATGDSCQDNLGGSGGGGGAGGCEGTPGTGGGAGGSSFGVFVYLSPGFDGGSAPTMTGNTIVRGRGGAGGSGGSGGAGGLGGFGGAGGFTYPNQSFCTSPGGNGGDGGSGGSGGGGGGGCAGSAFGMFLSADGQPFASVTGDAWSAANVIPPSGAGGRGGAGGVSTGGAGADGGRGAAGLVVGVEVR